MDNTVLSIKNAFQRVFGIRYGIQGLLSINLDCKTPNTRSHLKKRILVKYRGGGEFQPAGIHQYFEDLKRATNKEIWPKDFFEIASTYFCDTYPQRHTEPG